MSDIFISTSTFAQFSKAPLELLEAKGHKAVVNKLGRKLNVEEISDVIGNYSGILAGTELYTKEVLDKAKNLKVISRLGIGLDNIDQECTHTKGIKILKTKTTPVLSVAELSLGFILDLLRLISFHNQQLKNKCWKKHAGSLLYGKTLGIIGVGTIGKKLIEITKGFNLTYLGFDICKDNEFASKNKLTYCDLDDLLKNSDVVSVHLNLSEQNYGLIDLKHLMKMKKCAILINTSRGQIINEPDLEKALKEKIIAGAGLDVYENEPYQGSLLEYDNIITTPHIGSYAKEIRMAMELEAAENLIKALEDNS